MDKGVAHLLKACRLLECSNEIYVKSLLLYHQFKRGMPELQQDAMVAATCLHLSSKFYEQSIDLNLLICTFYSIVNETNQKNEKRITDVAVFRALKKSIIRLSIVMIRTPGFDLNCRLAHQYLMPFLLMIFERNKDIADFREQLSSCCILFLNDFYTKKICTGFTPDIICIACIDLSLHVYGFIDHLTMTRPWYKGFTGVLTPEDKVKAIKQVIMGLYDEPTTAVAAQNVMPRQEQIFARTELQ